MKKIELLAPAGSMANLKAAVSRKADAVYLGMKQFSARDFAANFNESYLKEAVKICSYNGVKLYLAMNTLVKNSELNQFFKQLSYAYSLGIDAVIIQEISFIDIIKKNFPGLKVHISTQSGVMNSSHAKLVSNADRLTLARELTKGEIAGIRSNFQKELELFCHGALCVSVSGSCIFSSLLGGRSGNRGKCAQPCRKQYNGSYYLSTKDLCLLERIPEIIRLGVNAIKIEGRMRSPYYVAAATEVYRKAIDSFYRGKFEAANWMKSKLYGAYSREFTMGWFDSSTDIFNRISPHGKKLQHKLEFYNAAKKDKLDFRPNRHFTLPIAQNKVSAKKALLVRAYSFDDAVDASSSGADIVIYDILSHDFAALKQNINCSLFGALPRIVLDEDIPLIKAAVKEKSPDGLFAANLGVLSLNLGLPVYLDYSANAFNDLDISYFQGKGAVPVISPELAMKELKEFANKNFAVLVHGRIRLMSLRHNLQKGVITDSTGAKFAVEKTPHGCDIINGKELGLLAKSASLVNSGINNFLIDSSHNVSSIVKLYRKILDGEKVKDRNLKQDYILGWCYRGVN